MTSILHVIMLGTGVEKVHGLKCLTVHVTWWGSCYCIELFNVQLFQIDPVDCVWSLTNLSEWSEPEWDVHFWLQHTSEFYIKNFFFSFIPVNDHLSWHTIWVKPACSLANCTGTSTVSVQCLAYSLNPCSVIIDTS